MVLNIHSFFHSLNKYLLFYLRNIANSILRRTFYVMCRVLDKKKLIVIAAICFLYDIFK